TGGADGHRRRGCAGAGVDGPRRRGAATGGADHSHPLQPGVGDRAGSECDRRGRDQGPGTRDQGPVKTGSPLVPGPWSLVPGPCFLLGRKMQKRYIVLILLILVSVITFLDRLAIAVAGPRMQDEL